MYYKGSKSKCEEIIKRLDALRGYPNTHTTTVSVLQKVPNSTSYVIKLPSDLYEELTSYEKGKVLDDKPTEFNAVD